MRQALAFLLVWLLASPAIAQFKNPSVKEQALTIARDTAVEVRLTDKSKHKGRMGAVSDDGFELQTERQGKITTEQIAFDRVKSVKALHRESAGRTVGKTILITGIVVGTVFGVIFLIAAIAFAVD